VLSDFFSWYTSSREPVSSVRGDIKRSEADVLPLRLPKHGIADRKVENAPVFKAEELRTRRYDSYRYRMPKRLITQAKL
jgi:hypothetical protein